MALGCFVGLVLLISNYISMNVTNYELKFTAFGVR